MENLIRKNVLYLVIVLVIAIPFAFAYSQGDITLVKSTLLTIFVSITEVSFLAFLVLLEKNPLGIQRSAPSIDGSISGWRLTNSLTLLLITCVFVIATLVVYVDKPKSMDSATERGPNQQDSTASNSQKTIDRLISQPEDSIKTTSTMIDSTK